MRLITLMCTALAVLSLLANADFVHECTIGEKNCQSCEYGKEPTCRCTRDDYKFWTVKGEANLEGSLAYCAAKSLSGDADVAKADAQECLEGHEIMSGFSKSCNECFASLISCSVESCFKACVSVRDGCVSCILNVSTCPGAFEKCSGWPTEPCEICVEEKESIIPNLEDKYFFIMVGGGGLLLIIVGAFLFYMVWCRTPKIVEITDIEDKSVGHFQIPLEAVTPPAAQIMTPTSSDGFRSGVSPPPGLGASRGNMRADSFNSRNSFSMDDFDDKPDI